MKTVAYLSMVVSAAALAVFMARDIAVDLAHGSAVDVRDVADPADEQTPPAPGPSQLPPPATVVDDPAVPESPDESAFQISGPRLTETEAAAVHDSSATWSTGDTASHTSSQIFAHTTPADGTETEGDSVRPVPQSEQEIPGDDVAAAAGPAAIRQQTVLHPQLITPGNFVYLGGFRPEFGDGNGSRFGLGGGAIAYRPQGDPHGPDDGHPGSLFLMGHDHQQLIAEITIPRPVVSPDRNINQLPEARMLQPFADITRGIRQRMTNGSSEPFKIGGLQVQNNRLHWTIYKYYNVTQQDYLSHGLTSVDLSSAAVRGLWHLGPQGGGSRWHSYKNAGYVASIPQKIADRYLQGKNLMSGLQISTGRQASSQGPALYAYQVADENLPAGSSLEAVPLLWYPMQREMTGHHPADSWQGAAWLTLGKKQAVVIVGRKGLGPVHYGMPRPGECYDYKGYHASHYEVQMLFYDPRQILAGASKSVPHGDPWYRWNGQTPGGGLNRFMYQDCGKEIGGLAYDRDRNLLYICEVDAAKADVNAYEALPVIHVFRLVE